MKLDKDMFKVGSKVFLWGLNKMTTGTIVALHDDSVILDNASWVADSGRFHEFMQDPASKASEVEMYPGKIQLNTATLIDATLVSSIPKETK